MNEGLIVVSEKDKSLQFASKPAVQLLKQTSKKETGNSLIADKKNIPAIKLEKNDFEKPLFSLYQFEINNENIINDNNIKHKMSLDSIVKEQIKDIEDGKLGSESKIYIS